LAIDFFYPYCILFIFGDISVAAGNASPSCVVGNVKMWSVENTGANYVSHNNNNKYCKVSKM